MLHCNLRVRWKIAGDLRFRAAISKPKTHSFCGVSGDLAPSTRKSLAIAIVRFWCAERKSLGGTILQTCFWLFQTEEYRITRSSYGKEQATHDCMSLHLYLGFQFPVGFFHVMLVHAWRSTFNSTAARGAERLFRVLGEVCSFSTEQENKVGHSEAPKRSHFPGCPLRGFQPLGSYPRATDIIHLEEKNQ